MFALPGFAYAPASGWLLVCWADTTLAARAERLYHFCPIAGTYKLRRELNYSVDDTVVVHGGFLGYEEKASCCLLLCF